MAWLTICAYRFTLVTLILLSVAPGGRSE